MVTPVNVVSTAYLVSQMARPVRLSNGWLVGVVADNTTNTYPQFYKSLDNGKTWTFLTSVNFKANAGLSIVSKGTRVYCLATATAGTISGLIGFDATTVSIAGQNVTINPDTGQSSFGSGCSLGITPDGTKLWWGAPTKNPTYPNSFNIRAGSIPINADGTLGTPSAVEQVSKFNTSSSNVNNPCIIFVSNAPYIIVNALYDIALFTTAFTTQDWTAASNPSWGNKSIYTLANYSQSNPTSCKTPNGKQHVAWHGTDSSSGGVNYIRYSNATTGTDWLATPKKLVPGTNATITSDKNGKLIIHYEDAGNIKRIESTDEFATWTAPVTVEAGTKPVSLFDPTFSTNFTIPPTVYQTASAVRYYGEVNNSPTLTLTNPANNQTLSEGNSYQVDGSATDTDNGNVVTIKYKINNGTTRALNSGVSNGSTPISFAKTLTFHDKRLWDGTTDVTGADLAEGTNHTLTVWVEDDQGGVSSQVARTFTVIWNRPPTISGSDQNLGSISAIPSKIYSATDPEGNAFTFSEYLNGQLLRSFAGTAGQNYTITIDEDTWLTLELDVPHQLKVRATDSQGLYSERIYTFTRTEAEILFELNLDDPDTLAFFSDPDMPKRVLVTLDDIIPTGAAITKVEVTNNALDATPTWEDATGPAKAGRGYLFTNTTKTATNWCVNIRVTIDKGTATDRVILNGFGGAFD